MLQEGMRKHSLGKLHFGDNIQQKGCPSKKFLNNIGSMEYSCTAFCNLWWQRICWCHCFQIIEKEEKGSFVEICSLETRDLHLHKSSSTGTFNEYSRQRSRLQVTARVTIACERCGSSNADGFRRRKIVVPISRARAIERESPTKGQQ